MWRSRLWPVVELTFLWSYVLLATKPVPVTEDGGTLGLDEEEPPATTSRPLPLLGGKQKRAALVRPRPRMPFPGRDVLS
jgi:hypothetical protein